MAIVITAAIPIDAVYVDAKEEKRLVALRPKPAFRNIFEVATTRKGSKVILVKESELDGLPPGEGDIHQQGYHQNSHSNGIPTYDHRVSPTDPIYEPEAASRKELHDGDRAG